MAEHPGDYIPERRKGPAAFRVELDSKTAGRAVDAEIDRAAPAALGIGEFPRPDQFPRGVAYRRRGLGVPELGRQG